MRLVPGAYPPAADAARPRGVDAAASVSATAPLWARGVTPTSEVLCQCISRSASSPDAW